MTTVPSSAPGPRPSVLVVEDDLDVRRLLQAHLQRLGCDVRAAASGEEGLAMAFAAAPDVAVIDVVLPGLDGRDVMRTLRGHAATRGCALVLTTVLDPDDVGGHADVGPDAVLPKPFTRQDVRRVLASVRPPAQELP